MSVLKTIEKGKVKFLMDYDYNNILGRLKFALGQDASFFADIQVRKADITWSTKSNLEYKPFIEASETEKGIIRKSIDNKKQRICRIIADDALIGNVVTQITTFPSEQYVYYAACGNDYDIIITGWGCRITNEQQRKEQENQQANTSHDNNGSNQKNNGITQNGANKRATNPQPNHSKITDGFFIGDEKTPQKKKVKRTKGELIKSILLVFLTAILALIIPIILTPFVNRFIADVTHQWYLSGGTRVLITFFITSLTYSLAYLIIRFTLLRKSIIFDSICLILTFLWSVFAGMMWMPD